MKNLPTSPTPFLILVEGCPRQSKSHLSAQKFIAAIYESSLTVSQIFFYGDATAICGNTKHQTYTEKKTQQQWLLLSQKYGIPLYACISTAIKRGVIDAQEAVETSQHENLQQGFVLEGLGTLSEALAQNNKLIEFGA